MRSAASRDAMQNRVTEAFKKWPSFEAMPATKQPGRRSEVIGAGAGRPVVQENYVKALYACCADSIPVGRDGVTIVGTPAPDEEDLPARAPGRRLVTNG